jgi:hypothetical protein
VSGLFERSLDAYGGRGLPCRRCGDADPARDVHEPLVGELPALPAPSRGQRGAERGQLGLGEALTSPLTFGEFDGPGSGHRRRRVLDRLRRPDDVPRLRRIGLRAVVVGLLGLGQAPAQGEDGSEDCGGDGGAATGHGGSRVGGVLLRPVPLLHRPARADVRHTSCTPTAAL